MTPTIMITITDLDKSLRALRIAVNMKTPENRLASDPKQSRSERFDKIEATDKRRAIDDRRR